MKVNKEELGKLTETELNSLMDYCYANANAFTDKKDYYLTFSGHCIIEMDRRIDKLIIK